MLIINSYEFHFFCKIFNFNISYVCYVWSSILSNSEKHKSDKFGKRRKRNEKGKGYIRYVVIGMVDLVASQAQHKLHN